MEMSQRKKKLEKDIEAELGDDYILDLKKNYDLPEDQKYDIIPELWEGHNIADYVDPEIDKKLAELEKEEEELERNGFYDWSDSEDEETQEVRKLARKIKSRKALMKNDSFVKNTTKPTLGRNPRKRERSVSRLRSEMGRLGVELDDEPSHYREASKSVERGRPLKRAREDSEGRVRSSSRRPRSESGLRDVEQQKKVRTIAKKAQTGRNRNARKGEGDRHIPDSKPKHLFCGKRKNGTHNRR